MEKQHRVCKEEGLQGIRDGSVRMAAPNDMTRADMRGMALRMLPDPKRCPTSIGARYEWPVRKLEWLARPLWAVGALLAGGEPDGPELLRYRDAIKDGLVEDGPDTFPMPTLPARQIVVEMAPFGFCLLAAGPRFLSWFDDAERTRLATWLNACNDVELPWGNWYVLRLLVNCGLRKCGLPYSEQRLQADSKAIESMYTGEGWYEDGTPFQRDYYVATTFHFISLLLERYASSNPIAQTVERARAFERDYACWFDAEGRALPFGRSLSYRIANLGFWGAEALAGCSVYTPGQLRRMVARALGWWRSCALDADEPLYAGYAYPNDNLAEDYTGPGAPYWACEAFVPLALPQNDPFWLEEQAPIDAPAHSMQEQPSMLLVRGRSHVCAFSAKQYSAASVLQRMSKYGKLCYSTAFGWNVSRDVEGISNFAVDSALALSILGTGQFTGRSRIEDGRVEDGYVYSLWSYRGIAQVETWLVPIDAQRHVRVHRVSALYPLKTYEGGFPVFGWTPKYDVSHIGQGSAELLLADERACERGVRQVSSIADIAVERESIVRALGQAGLSGLVSELGDEWSERSAEAVRQNPNTNIYSCEQNAVPVLKASLPVGTSCLACLVVGQSDRIENR